MNNYCEALKDMRENKGYSQNALAKMTGIAQPKICYYEKGHHAPPIDFCIQLAQFYGCTLDELVGLSDNDTGKYEQNDSNPTTKMPANTITFIKDFGEMFSDKTYVDISKLCKSITPEMRALILGYVIGILQRNNVDTDKIIGY